MSEQDIKSEEKYEMPPGMNMPENVKDPSIMTPEDRAEKGWMRLAVGSLIVTIAAWVLAGFNGWIGVALSAVAIAIGFSALRSRRHSVRNTAITAIIASAVLLVVLLAFYIVIYLGLKSI